MIVSFFFQPVRFQCLQAVQMLAGVAVIFYLLLSLVTAASAWFIGGAPLIQGQMPKVYYI
jgi:hypothetical protein